MLRVRPQNLRSKNEQEALRTWEGSEASGALTGADVPAIVTLLQYVHRVSLVQFQLVGVLWSILVHRAVSEVGKQDCYENMCKQKKVYQNNEWLILFILSLSKMIYIFNAYHRLC